ncbi:MAG: extracellular solute-binding protein [Caldilineaceae bacterium]|nr:extracellular solute-binding protein [Caldilineaceae bacterium]
MKATNVDASMPMFRSKWRQVELTWLWALIAFAISGCGQMWSQPTLLAATPTPVVESDVDAVVMEGETADNSTDDRELVLWVPDFVSVSPDEPSGNALTAAIHQFEQANPGVRVNVQVKHTAGQSSLLNYLLSAQRAAPSVLPDIALVNAQNLWQLADLGMTKPIDDDELARIGEFYPFAVDAVRYQEQIQGLPFAADVIHFVYFTSETDAPPQDWEGVLGGNIRYLFPVGGRDGQRAESVLLQYVGAGGQLLENGVVDDPEALEAVFRFMISAQEAGLIPEYVEDLTTLESVWSTLITEGTGYANVSSNQYLGQKDLLSGIGYAQVPTRNGLPATIGRTWALVVLADEPEQQALAQGLAEHLLDPAIQGTWSQLAHHLPSQSRALALWTDATPYQEFLGRQLDIAVALPNGRAFVDFVQRVQIGLLAIMRRDTTPEEALLEIRTTP